MVLEAESDQVEQARGHLKQLLGMARNRLDQVDRSFKAARAEGRRHWRKVLSLVLRRACDHLQGILRLTNPPALVAQATVLQRSIRELEASVRYMKIGKLGTEVLAERYGYQATLTILKRRRRLAEQTGKEVEFATGEKGLFEGILEKFATSIGKPNDKAWNLIEKNAWAWAHPDDSYKQVLRFLADQDNQFEPLPDPHEFAYRIAYDAMSGESHNHPLAVYGEGMGSLETDPVLPDSGYALWKVLALANDECELGLGSELMAWQDEMSRIRGYE